MKTHLAPGEIHELAYDTIVSPTLSLGETLTGMISFHASSFDGSPLWGERSYNSMALDNFQIGFSGSVNSERLTQAQRTIGEKSSFRVDVPVPQAQLDDIEVAITLEE